MAGLGRFWPVQEKIKSYSVKEISWGCRSLLLQKKKFDGPAKTGQDRPGPGIFSSPEHEREQAHKAFSVCHTPEGKSK